MRESWTDERLDEFAKRIDERFDRVDERFEQVDRRFEQIDRRFEAMQQAMTTGFEAVNRNMLYGLVGIFGVMITGFVALATQI